MNKVNVLPVALLFVVCMTGCVPVKKYKTEKVEYRMMDTLCYQRKDSVLQKVMERDALKSTLHISRVEYFQPDSTGKQYIKQHVCLSSGTERKVRRDSVSATTSDIVFTETIHEESLDERKDEKLVSPFFWLACGLFLVGMGNKICSSLKKL